MPNAKKVLTEQLIAVIEPHLTSEVTDSLSSDAIAKVLRKLTKHVLGQSSEGLPTEPASKAQPLAASTTTTKHAHKALVAQLQQQVQSYVGAGEESEQAPAKVLTKTIKRLAKQLVKQRRKKAKPAHSSLPATQPNVLPTPAAQPNTSKAKPLAAARRAATTRAPRKGSSGSPASVVSPGTKSSDASA